MFIRHVLLGFHSIAAHCAPAEPRLPAPPRPTIRKNAAPNPPPKYDCSGGLQEYSEEGRAYIERAIDDAIKLLEKCEPCRLIFRNEDPKYAIELLKRLRRDKVIIISSRVPLRWVLSPDHRKLTVMKSAGLKEAAAVVIDLAGPRQGEMKRPCIYVNPAEFIVTGKLAEEFGLYGLDPPVQRAVALLHELGHVAGVIQYDGEDPKDPLGNRKSGDNTNCVRLNCITCKEFKSCPNAPELPTRRRHKPQVLNFNP